MGPDARSPAGRADSSGRRYGVVWGVIFAVVCALLVPSAVRFLAQDPLLARHLVETDGTADTRPAGIRGRAGERVLEVRLPEVETVTVLDERWGRDEALEVPLLRDAP